MIELSRDLFESLMMNMNYTQLMKFCLINTTTAQLCENRQFFIKYIWKKSEFEFNMDNLQLQEIKDIASLTDIIDLSRYDNEDDLFYAGAFKVFYEGSNKFYEGIIKSILRSDILFNQQTQEIVDIFNSYYDAELEDRDNIIEDIRNSFHEGHLLTDYIDDIFRSYSTSDDTLDIYEYLKTEKNTVYNGLLEFTMSLLEFFGNNMENIILSESYIEDLLKDYHPSSQDILEKTLVSKAEYVDFVEILDLHIDIFGGVGKYRNSSEETRFLYNWDIERILHNFKKIMDEEEYSEQMIQYEDRMREILEN